MVRSGSSSRSFSESEAILNSVIFFTNNKEPNKDLYLEVGEYAYPFQIPLPIDLSTSFEHENCSIRYTLNATIDIPWLD